MIPIIKYDDDILSVNGVFGLFIETKTIEVKQGTADKVVDRFSGEGIIEQSEGFIRKR